jgi:hypothetical protein
MATQNVKILLRRGLREQLTTDVLDTGEMGFTVDTNQLFIGIDPAINEVQFDPFVNAHAIIQTWLDSDDCPFPGLIVDEDLVIRNIPITYEDDGTPVSGIQALLDAMHFFTQTINLVGDFDVDAGEKIYQRRFVYSDDETNIDSLEAGKTYKIVKVGSNAQAFFINASGLISKTFTKHDNFTVRADYADIPNPSPSDGSRVVEIIGTADVTSGTVSIANPYDSANNKKEIIVRLREGDGEFILDHPYVDNYYHFNGNGVDNSLDTDFGLFVYVTDAWVKQGVSIIDEKNHPDHIEQTTINGVEIDKPTDDLLSDTTLETHVVVTKSSKVTYWKNDTTEWKLLGDRRAETADAILNINAGIHTLPQSVLDSYNAKPGGKWEFTFIQNEGESNETITDIVEADFTVDTTAGTVSILLEGDQDEDRLVASYFFNDELQFSNNPPIEYTNQDQTFSPLATRENGDPLIDGDYYIYTDKDITGGVNLNIFKWEPEDFSHVHDNVPVFYSDALAVANATPGILIYAVPYTFDTAYTTTGILELRKRDYDTSTFWYPYDYNDILSYYFTLNPEASVTEPDLTYAWSISGKSQFSIGYLGRARRNVEVVTENSFNQLFADQHLSAQAEYSGLRPSLFRKSFDDEDGAFLKYNKYICNTFFIDYSLKQTVGTTIFLRVGTLKIINGYPHDIPEIKLTDENTEIWHDAISGNDDNIADRDEFSNIEFETAIEEDIYGNPTDNLIILYRQDAGSYTEVSYTVKRWTT